MRTFLAGLLVAVFFVSTQIAQADGPQELRIVRVTPSGDDVQDERQIVIEFNRAIVPIGKWTARRSRWVPP